MARFRAASSYSFDVGNSTLTDFYTYNDPAHSHPEDNISVYNSPNVKICIVINHNTAERVAVMFGRNSAGGSGHVTRYPSGAWKCSPLSS